MPNPVIEAMLAKNWTYTMIALRANVSEDRLRANNLGRRETERLERVAELEARIDLDLLDVEGEE